MPVSNNKISLRQALMLVFLSTLSPSIRIIPQLAASGAGKAGWLTPIAAVIPAIYLIFLVNSFYKKNKGANLSDLFCSAVGNIAGKIILSIYLIYLLVLTCVYVRYYADRILSSMMPNIPYPFLVIVMLCLIFYGCKKGLTTIARAGEVFLGIFMFIFLFSFLFSTPQIQYKNLLNVSYQDIWPVMTSSLGIISVWCYYFFIFFFGDKIDNKDMIKKYSLTGLILIFIVCTMILVMTIGTLGSTMTGHVSLPFFTVVKNITLAGTIDHIEALVLGLWVISDFVVISVFLLIITSMLKSIFNLSSSKSMISPVLIFIGIGSLFFFKNRFELETASKAIFMPTNIILTYIVPLIILIIGKIRKKI